MEIEALIQCNKDIYLSLMDFIDSTDDSDDKYEELIKIFDIRGSQIK